MDKNGFRAAGDEARSKGAWGEAAANYKAYLDEAPRDFSIWVQLGHAYKESGDFQLARAAYREAINLKPDDSDVHLNLGHLEKLAGARDAAIAAYVKAHELASEDKDALRELIGLDADLSELPGAETLTQSKTIYFDVTDLIEYVKTNSSLSGIQRVVANLIEGADGEISDDEKYNIIPVIPEYDNMRIFSVSRVLVLAMVDELHKARDGRSRLDKAIAAVYASRKIVEPKRGDIFTIAGAFWIYVHYDMVRRLREHGVKFIVFIHDLIQISHPQYVHEAATLTFRRALVDVLTLANGVLTNSEFVAQDVRNFMRKNMNFELPVQSILLSTELTPANENESTLSDRVAELLDEPYVLSVSTIEVRKNHMYMIRLWEKLIEDKVEGIPNLVFVGKIGWDIEALTQYLENSDYLGGRLHLIHGVTDYELGELYKHAMFTMFPSFVEGFGLPLGESLAYGKPCISSNRSSMPEVGGKFARYVNPEDVHEGYVLVRDLIEHPNRLDEWTQDIATGYKPKTWRQFAAEYFAATVRVSKPDDSPVNGVLEVADVVGAGRQEINRRDGLGKSLTYLSAARVKGWHPVEDWGCWTSSRRATLRFNTRLAADAEICVYLKLQTPGQTDHDKISVRVEVGGVLNVFKPSSSSSSWFVAEGKTGAEGEVSIVFFSAGPFDKDHRELYVGLRALAFCVSADALSRIKIVEKITFGMS